MFKFLLLVIALISPLAFVATPWTAESARRYGPPAAAPQPWAALDLADRAGEWLVPLGLDVPLPGTIELAALDGTNGFRVNGISRGDYAGSAVSSAGDVNGDGFDDVLIGVPGANQSYVVYGRPAVPGTVNLSDINGTNGFRVNGFPAGVGSGKDVSGAGDVNGDGFDDILIAEPYASPHGSHSGQIYVVYGGPAMPRMVELSALDDTHGFRVNGISPQLPGWFVNGARDVNGDGFDDVLIGAPQTDQFDPSSEQAYVVYGGPAAPGTIELSGLNGTSGFRIRQASSSLNGAGDVNSDGFDDILIGQDAIDAYVLYGGSALPATVDLGSLVGARGFRIKGKGGNFSWALSGAGDVNGDRFDDMLVGAPFSAPNGMWSGQSYVVYGGSAIPDIVEISEMNGTNGFRVNGISPKDRAGRALSGAGDVNGDGVDDILIAASNASPHGEYSGQSYVLYGGSTVPGTVELSALDGVSGFRLNGVSLHAYSGWSVSGARDVNGDGFDDLVIGARRADNQSGNYGGQAYVVYGGGERRPKPNSMYLPSVAR